MIHEPRGAGSGQSTHPLSPSEKIAHGGNRTRGSLPLAPWPLVVLVQTSGSPSRTTILKYSGDESEPYTSCPRTVEASASSCVTHSGCLRAIASLLSSRQFQCHSVRVTVTGSASEEGGPPEEKCAGCSDSEAYCG